MDPHLFCSLDPDPQFKCRSGSRRQKIDDNMPCFSSCCWSRSAPIMLLPIPHTLKKVDQSLFLAVSWIPFKFLLTDPDWHIFLNTGTYRASCLDPEWKAPAIVHISKKRSFYGFMRILVIFILFSGSHSLMQWRSWKSTSTYQKPLSRRWEGKCFTSLSGCMKRLSR